MIHVEINNQQAHVRVDEGRLRSAVEAVLRDGGRTRGTISVAVVDDAAIRPINRRFLDHDFATDVLSFVLEEGPELVDGEIVASGQTACATAPRYGWNAEDELLLYVIHGALHLVGLDDRTPIDATAMRAREAAHLERFGLRAPPMNAGPALPGAAETIAAPRPQPLTERSST